MLRKASQDSHNSNHSLGRKSQNKVKSQKSASKKNSRAGSSQGAPVTIELKQETNENNDFLLKAPTVYRQELDVAILIDVCTKKLQDDPTHKKALFIRSSSFLKKGFLNEAISDCDQLLKLSPRNAGAYYVRGCIQEKMGNISQGIEDFTRVLEIDPDHVNAAYSRGACENKRGNFDKAIEDY